MKKLLKGLVLVTVLLMLAGCTRTSEAKVNIFNKGELAVKITIYYTTSQINPGMTDTFTVTWPGRSVMHVSMTYFPVGQPARSIYQDLALNNGDVLDLNVEFMKN